VSGNPHRLPRTVAPRRYDLELQPDLTNATFSGAVTIELDVLEPTSEIVCNALEMEIDTALVNGKAVTYRLDEPTERLMLQLATPIEPGTATLTITFRGILNDMLRGFYRSTFVDDEGVSRTIATTQMQATDCRRAFPCWDEPDFKAVFGVTLVIPESLQAISNGPELSRSTRPDQHVAVTFADTMKMSSYLVAFVVGPLEMTEPIDVDGVQLRIVHVPGKGHLTGFGAEIGAFSLRYFQKYYGIPYPGGKVDLVALPDFAAGAMENVGCITFRETLLLLDPATATRAEEQSVSDVVAHEVAHMWFGDLVTMRWWNGIWLNEAFATFMEVAAVAEFRPEWDRWTSFMLDRQPAFEVDSLANTRPVEFEVLSPEDADGMFDTLTYEKGGALLRMLEQYLGAEKFREGIGHYLTTHAYGNTETGDLWDAIEATSGQPVRRIMDTWIWQRGYPLVTVALDGNDIVLTQSRFRFDGEPDDTRWAIPLHVKQLTNDGEHVDVVLLEGESTRVALRHPDAAVVANGGSYGFVRVAASADLLVRLTGPTLKRLSTSERVSLVDDAWAAVVAGQLGADDFCQFAQGFADETAAQVWQMMLAALTWCERLVEGKTRERFQAFVRGLLGPVLARIGWSPAEGESDLVGELRGSLIRGLATVGDDANVQRRCRRLHAESLADPSAVDSTVAAAALSAVAFVGTDADYDACLARYRTSDNPQEKVRELMTLTGFPAAHLIDRTLALALTDEVKTQNAPFVVARCIANREHGERAWRFTREHWTEINERFPANIIYRMVEPVKTLTKPEQHADVAAFFAEHDIPQSRKQLLQVLERHTINVGLRERANEQLTRAFA
jgi:puromycin-sensitive aminopeptidase